MTGVKAPSARKGLSAALAAVFLVAFLAEALAENHAYRLFVDGLACPFCAYGVEKKVGGLKGVETVEIDIESGLVAVTVADDATLDEAAAKQAVDEAGFTLRKFEAPKK